MSDFIIDHFNWITNTIMLMLILVVLYLSYEIHTDWYQTKHDLILFFRTFEDVWETLNETGIQNI